MKKIVLTAALAGLALGTSAFAQDAMTATANFVGKDGKEAGRATLTEAKDGVLIEVEATGLPPGTWVAFHVHETGKCDHAGGHESAGGHFDDEDDGKAEHGFLAANGPHDGDMPNQYVSADGVMRAHIYNSAVSLNDDDDRIRGRALMIHAKPDDYRSQPSGGAGERLACAVIK
ncbi:superoxide dismutase family protein [Pararhizobium sp.]|uniref:superoxide dismutase family protein n=1 Tax=Pararhizobium sp. TaxID=1977563 RepID=UPI00271FAFEB|nr:superoxide dismutase family protein [Pararhizobium sp.]MDO9417513.1 superoxide dismutase family protein [Pararhizobium sp.]